MSIAIFESESPEDQAAVCAQIVADIESHPVVLFSGEMGAGKTTLIKNICKLLKVNDAVSSPTFSLVNEYKTDQDESVFHFDFYRIKDPMEAIDMACEDYFYSGSICLIEWPEMITSVLPDSYLHVRIESANGRRNITVRKIN